jgi:hypothetical protein
MTTQREPLQTVEYFQGNIAERLEEIAKREGYLANRAEQRMNWKAILLGLHSDYGRLLSCCYSIGTPVEELRPYLHASLKWGAGYFQEPDSDKGKYSDYFDIFYQAVTTLSWAILLKADEGEVLNYIRSIDQKLKPEPIIDHLMVY